MIATVCLAIIAASPSLAQEPKVHGHFYSLAERKGVGYPLPDYCRLEGAQYSEGVVRVSLKGPYLPSSDRFVVEAYFDTNMAAVWVNGFNLATMPPVTSRNAAVIDLSDKSVAGSASVAVEGWSLSIRFDPLLVGPGKLHYVVARYLPSKYDLADVSGGMGGCVADLVLASDEGEQQVLAHNGLYDVKDWRVGIYLRPGPEFGFPPRGPRAGDVVKVVDVSGDFTFDWQHSPCWRVPNSKIKLGSFAFDIAKPGADTDDPLALAWGIDRNGNNLLDPGEIRRFIAHHEYQSGKTFAWMQRHPDDLEWYVHWVLLDTNTGAFKHTVGKVHMQFVLVPIPPDSTTLAFSRWPLKKAGGG